MIKITVSGPGATFSGPLLKIKQALEELGCSVIMNDPHPVQDERVSHLIERQVWTQTPVIIEAQHHPWGG